MSWTRKLIIGILIVLSFDLVIALYHMNQCANEIRNGPFFGARCMINQTISSMEHLSGQSFSRGRNQTNSLLNLIEKISRAIFPIK